jgi:hypothetical protein
MYTYDTTSSNMIPHAKHDWEEWHAYLVDCNLPENISGDATGICCHTCFLVVLDVSAEN